MDAPETLRMRLTVHYDGSAFFGWQVQPDQRTVQGELEAALSRLADRRCTVLGSGRTDTGVHATGQVASVDMPPTWTATKLHRSLNSIVPRDVWVESVREVAADFHPRYDAVLRTYRYEVGLRPESASPFHSRWCWPLCEDVDLDLLSGGADAIVGEHSFAGFAKAGQPERGERCHVRSATWSDTSLGARFTISADRYLHHMVRYLVGTTMDVARGRRPLEDVTRLLAREPGVVTSPPAPAEGLFLHRVEYPDDASADGSGPNPRDIASARSPTSA